jgi:hypothetical protein
MDKEYNIISVDKPDDSVWEVVGGGIRSYNLQQAGESGHKELCVVLRALDKKTLGGLICANSSFTTASSLMLFPVKVAGVIGRKKLAQLYIERVNFNKRRDESRRNAFQIDPAFMNSDIARKVFLVYSTKRTQEVA